MLQPNGDQYRRPPTRNHRSRCHSSQPVRIHAAAGHRSQHPAGEVRLLNYLPHYGVSAELLGDSSQSTLSTFNSAVNTLNNATCATDGLNDDSVSPVYCWGSDGRHDCPGSICDMKVPKFGGSSLATTSRIRGVAEIVRRGSAREAARHGGLRLSSSELISCSNVRSLAARVTQIT